MDLNKEELKKIYKAVVHLNGEEIEIHGSKEIKIGYTNGLTFNHTKDNHKDLWLVSYNTPYYPSVEAFDSYEEARAKYDYLKLEVLNARDDLDPNMDAIYLSRVQEYEDNDEGVI